MENIPQQKQLPKLFNITCSVNELVRLTGGSLNDACWGAWFGEIQKILRSSPLIDTDKL
ncbi:MAG: hypothetical protein QX203_04140 [Methylococcaceae bacterium]